MCGINHQECLVVVASSHLSAGPYRSRVLHRDHIRRGRDTSCPLRGGPIEDYYHLCNSRVNSTRFPKTLQYDDTISRFVQLAAFVPCGWLVCWGGSDECVALLHATRTSTKWTYPLRDPLARPHLTANSQAKFSFRHPRTPDRRTHRCKFNTARGPLDPLTTAVPVLDQPETHTCAHHGHVALLNRPCAGPALVCEVLV